jgi:predicted nucleic acid-binding protein
VLVVDASAVVAYIGGGEAGHRVGARLVVERTAPWAPQLIDAEVGCALRRELRAGRISAARARHALADLGSLHLNRVDHLALLDRAWELADSLPVGDGLYVALAERLDAPLLTLDVRLAGAPGVSAKIDVLS